MNISTYLTAAVLHGTAAYSALAEVTIHKDFTDWQAATPGFVTIDFTDLSQFGFVTNQYADQGVLFTDGDDVVFGSDFATFPLDGFGVSGQGEFNLQFLPLQFSIATHFTGGGQLELFFEGALIYTSPHYSGTEGTFLGFVSTLPFDAARIVDPDDPGVVFDNLYFGVPGPGCALPLLALAGAIGTRRRRRSRGLTSRARQ
jgi:hypothetical protein